MKPQPATVFLFSSDKKPKLEIRSLIFLFELVSGLNVSVTELICSLKELTDVKLALDAEIATYRRLLMAEDGR